MTGQHEHDRQDERLTGPLPNQFGHCPLTGRYLEPWFPYNIQGWIQKIQKKGAESPSLPHPPNDPPPPTALKKKQKKNSNWTFLACHFFNRNHLTTPHAQIYLIFCHVRWCMSNLQLQIFDGISHTNRQRPALSQETEKQIVTRNTWLFETHIITCISSKSYSAKKKKKTTHFFKVGH